MQKRRVRPPEIWCHREITSVAQMLLRDVINFTESGREPFVRIAATLRGLAVVGHCWNRVGCVIGVGASTSLTRSMGAVRVSCGGSHAGVAQLVIGCSCSRAYCIAIGLDWVRFEKCD